RQKNPQARLRPDALDHEPDQIVGEVARDHEADVVDDKLQDALHWPGIAPAPSYHRISRALPCFSRSRCSTSVDGPSVPAHAIPRLLFELQIGGFDDVGEDLDVGLDLGAELCPRTAA